MKKTFRKDLKDGSVLIATVRFDDECKNGHNTFAITGEHYDRDRDNGEESVTNAKGKTRWLGSCGCLHEEIARHFPQLAPLIKWHLCSTDGPMHYVANTVYHADEHGPDHAWVYYTGPADPLGIEDARERCVGYVKADKAREVEGQNGYRVVWDEKTAKVKNLEHARFSAVWPDATDEELMSPDLAAKLTARLPALMDEFQKAVESLGFNYELQTV